MALPALKEPIQGIEKAPWFELTGYAPHEKQSLVHDSDVRFKVLVAGRRWGKSLLAAKEAGTMIMAPDTRGWVVSKNYALAEKVMRQIYNDFIRKMKVKPVRKLWSGPYMLEFPWGAVVEGKSADHPDGLLGEGLDWLIFDECAPASPAVWEQYLRPTLTDTEGWALFISTPRGYNWLYDLWQRGNDEDYPEWASWRSPSWENPHLSRADIEEARQTLPDATFRQEYGAEFTISSGQVYQEFDEELHVVSKRELRIHNDWPRYRAIDFGYENPFCCLWIAVDPSDRVIIYDEYYQPRKTISYHAKQILKKTKKQHFNWTVGDASARSERASLHEHGIVNCSSMRSVSVETGLDDVRRCLALRDDGTTGLIVSSKCVNTIREFNLYRYPDDGMKELPRKENDHAMDAARYFVVSWKRGTIRQEMARF